ncbi:hypothetical protein [Microcoleus sp. B4-D4]|uniref:hypothetical protein n=1 Tax=Microcoleus sp. B4-D4 TaxID=2818667 RepID=UPI002FD6CEE2
MTKKKILAAATLQNPALLPTPQHQQGIRWRRLSLPPCVGTAVDRSVNRRFQAYKHRSTQIIQS